jgi:hypothetical protein
MKGTPRECSPQFCAAAIDNAVTSSLFPAMSRRCARTRALQRLERGPACTSRSRRFSTARRTSPTRSSGTETATGVRGAGSTERGSDDVCRANTPARRNIDPRGDPGQGAQCHRITCQAGPLTRAFRSEGERARAPVERDSPRQWILVWIRPCLIRDPGEPPAALSNYRGGASITINWNWHVPAALHHSTLLWR